MYESFYGLTERPFDITPNPRFLFMTAAHRDVLATIQYAMSGRKGLTLVTGPPGTGKTTLVHAALQQTEGTSVRTLYLGNPTLSREEFFDFMAQELGLSAEAGSSKGAFLRELRSELLRQHAAGTHTALIIDEIQAMSDAMLEEVRLLENFETPTEKLLSVVLVGQPEMATRLRLPVLLPLRQRIALRSSLSPLTRSETSAYIAERIRIAGGDVMRVFSPEAIAAVCDACGGIPRNISVVCDNALVTGFAVDEKPISAAVVHEVCRDFDLPAARRDPAPAAAPAATRAAAAAAVPAVRPSAAAPVLLDTGLPVRRREPDMPVMSNLQLSNVASAVESLMVPSSNGKREKPSTNGTGRLHALTAPVRGLRTLFGKDVR